MAAARKTLQEVGPGDAVGAARTMAVTRTTPSPRPRWWAAGLAWVLWALGMLSLAVIWRLDHLLRQADRPDLAPLGAGVAAPVLASVSAATVGAVLASRRSRHPVGWLLLVLALSLNASGWPRRLQTMDWWPVPARFQRPAT
jgi:hypothetical protein